MASERKFHPEPLDRLAVYDAMAERDLDCDGSWFDDEGNMLNCLDVGADIAECCSACLGWWAVCELKYEKEDARREAFDKTREAAAVTLRQSCSTVPHAEKAISAMKFEDVFGGKEVGSGE